jgi:hypothetical protein
MKSGIGAGLFEGVGAEGFNRAGRARGPHAAGSRLARRPSENRRGSGSWPKPASRAVGAYARQRRWAPAR